ncbi:hypothetical protein C1Y26_02825 [Pseudomonas sp. MPR-R2A7]|nr:hypothetical protein C1Y23_08000 [Pseudomonas sp. GW460-12]PMX35865.1 hypothetical protein C1Y24_08600 [Pseudomonas sp. MPR-R2A4]PMX43522.1 hypothetical protein C1Y26_02825 [Pseudomonas sp. MPR-R2A7]PMX55206.1 hypothetical protein C1Y17_04640 [Pseudomonas sp. MPR-R2A6]PMX92660.1 hypothetical protein C1Y21_06335 [Pseudomonas sp. MPR-R2A3]PMY15982.1 hypothetical protein C1Y22_03720 [Pseudomonas sp. MPR-R2A5]PNA35139.1 hypothetical protein C1Y16_10185 [Pseudomonas sp. MPR-ANB1]PNA49014.1 hyp
MLIPVGASLLAKVVNDSAGILTPNGTLRLFASELAPTRWTPQPMKTNRVPFLYLYGTISWFFENIPYPTVTVRPKWVAKRRI